MMENLKNDSDSMNQSLVSLLNHNQLFDSNVANVRLSVNILGILLGTVGIVLNALLITSIVILKSSNKIVGSSKMSRTMALSLATADLLLLLIGLPYDLLVFNEHSWVENKLGCKMSALIPQLTRYAWIGSFLLYILLLDCKSIVQDHVSIWMILVWLISIVLSVPFGARVDCVTQQHSNVCFCVFTADQSEVVWLFVLSLILFSVAFTVTLAALSLTSSSQRPHLAFLMALTYMACTLPRYVYVILSLQEQENYYSTASAADSSHGDSGGGSGSYLSFMSVMDFVSHGFFYSSSLVQLGCNPEARQLLRLFIR